ncbi:DUF5317 domain-containing protein [Neofamilia massiliensis]|uniref:DUF5317 domain-containing protein n=1 Tax=Neofamilia massiliensis TaxID=1673724 RepID=UPI0006BB63EE|nr:DUF5317 domain-containing protein [Neofamilia massiliensis]
MVIEAIILGILLGKLRSGKISNLEDLKFKALMPLLGVFIFDLVLRFFIVKSTSTLAAKLFSFYPYFNLLIYLFIIFILEINKNLKYLRVVEAGFVLNYLPMIANGGKMPILKDALLSINKTREIDLLIKNQLLTHSLVNEATRFKALCDNIPIKYFLPKVISLGDIFLALGLVLFISYFMTRGRDYA